MNTHRVKKYLARNLPWITTSGGSLFCVLILFCITFAILFLFGLIKGIASEATTGKNMPIRIQPGKETAADPTYRQTIQKVEAPSTTYEETPKIDWQKWEHLRRAAALLLLDNDYKEAMKLLQQTKDMRNRAFAVDQTSHRKIISNLRICLTGEIIALRSFWQTLTQLEQSRLCRHDAPMLRATEKLCKQDIAAIRLPDLQTCMPEKLLLHFVRNLHLRLTKRTGANDTIVALILSLAFPQESLSAELYWEQFPRARVPYSKVLFIL